MWMEERVMQTRNVETRRAIGKGPCSDESELDLKFWAADRKTWGWLARVAETHAWLIEVQSENDQKEGCEALAFSKD